MIEVNQPLVEERIDRLMKQSNEILFPQYEGVEFKAMMTELYEVEMDILYDPSTSLWAKQNVLDRINNYLYYFKGKM